MKVITEERLKEVFSKLYWSTNDDKELFTALLSECTELNAWQRRRIVLEETEEIADNRICNHSIRADNIVINIQSGKRWKIVEDGK